MLKVREMDSLWKRQRGRHTAGCLRRLFTDRPPVNRKRPLREPLCGDKQSEGLAEPELVAKGTAPAWSQLGGQPGAGAAWVSGDGLGDPCFSPKMLGFQPGMTMLREGGITTHKQGGQLPGSEPGPGHGSQDTGASAQATAPGGVHSKRTWWLSGYRQCHPATRSHDNVTRRQMAWGAQSARGWQSWPGPRVLGSGGRACGGKTEMG